MLEYTVALTATLMSLGVDWGGHSVRYQAQCVGGERDKLQLQ